MVMLHFVRDFKSGFFVKTQSDKQKNSSHEFHINFELDIYMKWNAHWKNALEEILN